MTVAPDPVNLPFNVRRWAQIRISVASAWGEPWRPLTMITPSRNGFQLLRYRRVCLPEEGTAVFRLPYGKIDARLFTEGSLGLEFGAPDLHQYEVRIQGMISTGEWKTIWWGQCVAMRDVCFPGSDVKAGDMEYHCVDGFARLRRWYLNYHQFYWNSNVYRSRGHPGYNSLHGIADMEASLADALGLGFSPHTWPSKDPSDSLMWTDQKATENALLSSVPGLYEAGTTAATIAAARARFPAFPLYGQTEWLQGKNVYPVKEMETVRVFMERVFERARGRGLAFCDWTDDTGSAGTDTLAPRITIKSPVLDDITVEQAEGGDLTFPGSTSVKLMSLIGDHRLGKDAQRSFHVTAVSDIEHNAVEVLGERIIALGLFSTNDTSLEGRWNDAELTDLTAATRLERELHEAKFDHVLRRYGLPKGWDLQCGDGTGGNKSRIDYRFTDDGILQTPVGADGRNTSPRLISIWNRLPLYFGYDYTVDPVVAFNSANPPGDLDLVPPAIWIRVNDSPERYINGCHTLGMSISRHEQDLRITCADDKGARGRIIGVTGSTLGSRYNVNQMCLLAGIELPHRVRQVKSLNIADDSVGLKTKQIFVKDLHFWVCHPQAIVALDETTRSNGGYAPKRMVNGLTYLRDDRDRLSVILEMSAIWYLNRRRSATWTLSDIGFSDGYFLADEDGMEGTTLKAWPHLGDLIDEFAYSGRTEELMTPVTLEEYDHVAGRYTWATSWTNLDWK